MREAAGVVKKPGGRSLCRLFTLFLLAFGLTAAPKSPAVAADAGFAQVTGPCRQSFPTDHAPHPDYRTEWWYFTGNLTDGHGRRLGFQLTFFHSRLKPPAERRNWPRPASAWRTDQIYLAHAAVTDVAGRRHLQAEKIARPVLGIAGTTVADGRLSIALHGWQMTITPEAHRLNAESDEFKIDLALTPAKPPVRHGNQGYSRKGQTPERASCYYSFTRLEAAGTIKIYGVPREVKGSAWMDHEFSSAPLQPGLTGWDWFSLQLSDQTEVMLYLLRDKSGGVNPASSGSYILPSGEVRHLQRRDVTVVPQSYWTSPHSGARYPVKWQVNIEPLDASLSVTANLADQEMRTPNSTAVTYWEGSVSARGTKRGTPVDGVGYVELTGYEKPFDAPM